VAGRRQSATLKTAKGRALVMAQGIEEEQVPATPAIGITLILVGVLLVLGVLRLETLLGLAGIVVGVLILIGEFA
jgi:hypothetical protein